MIKSNVKKNIHLVRLYNKLIQVINSDYAHSSLDRKSIDLFNISELAKPIKYYPNHFIKENDYYGHGDVLFSALSIKESKQKFYKIEHGLFLGDLVHADSYNGFISHIITFSDYRKNILEATEKNVVCVGPYIKHANELLSFEDKLRLKNNFGSVLLVFPSHSIDSIHVSYDISQFIDYIESIKHDFDNVVVCMYWKDILLGQHKEYQEHGYGVTTAGHTYDSNFLPRLKSIIDLSSATVSNKVGTHVGYCISMGKPHKIFKSTIKYDFINNAERYVRNSKELDSYDIACREIKNVFNVSDFEITDAQIDLVKKYWGDY